MQTLSDRYLYPIKFFKDLPVEGLRSMPKSFIKMWNPFILDPFAGKKLCFRRCFP